MELVLNVVYVAVIDLGRTVMIPYLSIDLLGRFGIAVAPAPVSVTEGLAPGPTFSTAPSAGSITVGAVQVDGGQGAGASWRHGLGCSIAVGRG